MPPRQLGGVCFCSACSCSSFCRLPLLIHVGPFWTHGGTPKSVKIDPRSYFGFLFCRSPFLAPPPGDPWGITLAPFGGALGDMLGRRRDFLATLGALWPYLCLRSFFNGFWGSARPSILGWAVGVPTSGGIIKRRFGR